MADNIVGTAFVRIRALTDAVKNDIKKGIDKGVKDAQPATKKSGEKLGSDLGDGIGKGIEKNRWDLVLAKRIQDALKRAEVAERSALKSLEKIRNDFRKRELSADTAAKKALQKIAADFQKIQLRDIAAMSRAQEKYLRDQERATARSAEQNRRTTELSTRARIKSAEDAALREIRSTIKVSQNYQAETKKILTSNRTLLKGTETLRNQVTESIKKSLQDGSVTRFMDTRGAQLGDRFGKSFANSIGSIRTRAFFLAAFSALLIPALGGLLKIAGAYIGNLVSLFASIGPAVTAASVVGVSAIGALVQGISVLGIALSGESEALEAFKEATTEVFEPLRAVLQEALFPGLSRSIERLSKSVLPILERELVDTAGAINGVISEFTALADQYIFEQNFARVLSSNTKSLSLFGSGLVAVADAATTVLAAAAPLTQFFATYVRDTARGWAESLRLAQATGQLSQWFERAGATLQQLGRIGENTRRALSETFQAASDTGQTLLNRIEELTSRWRAWTESASGQNQLEQYFRSSSIIVAEVNGLIGDMFRMLGQGIADNPNGIAAFVRSLRTEALPALAGLGSALAALAPAAVQLLTTISHLVQTMSESGAINAFTSSINGALTVVRTLLDIPVAGQLAGWALAFLAINKALSIASFGLYRKGIEGIGAAFGGLVSTLGRNANVGVRGALAGFATALGPGGIVALALGGAAVVLGIFLQKQAEAKQRAQEHKAALDGLASTLDETTGAITRYTREAVAADLAERGHIDTARELGIEQGVVTDAALGNAQAQDQVTAALKRQEGINARQFWQDNREMLEAYGVTLEDVIGAHQGNGAAIDTVTTKLASNQIVLGDLRESVNGTSDQYSSFRQYILDVAGAMAEQQDATRAANDELSAHGERAETLAASIDVLRDAASDAADRVSAFTDALAILNGEEVDLEKANRDLAQALRDSDDALVDSTASAEAGKQVYLDMSGAINQTTGEFDSTTAVGYQVAETYDALFQKATVASEAIAASGGNAAAAQQPFIDAKTEILGLAEAAGATPPELAAIDAGLRQIPTITQLELLLQDDQANSSIEEANRQLDALDVRETITKLLGNNQPLADKLIESHGDLDVLDQTIATATADMDPSKANAVYVQVMAALRTLDGQRPVPLVDMDSSQLQHERSLVLGQLAELNRQRPTPEVRAEISAAQDRLRQIDSELASTGGRNPTPTVGVNDRASGILGAIQGLLAGIQSKTVTVTTHHRVIKGRDTMVASGGLISGPGTGTSDSIPARLSDGEYVINARATKAFLPLLHRINTSYGGKRSPSTSQTRFATGGLASSTTVDSRLLRATSSNISIDTTSTSTPVQTVIQNHFHVDTPAALSEAKRLASAITKQQRRDDAVKYRTLI